MWEYSHTEETIVGMNEITGELAKINIYICPKCQYEVTDYMITKREYNYCPRCGNKNSKS